MEIEESQLLELQEEARRLGGSLALSSPLFVEFAGTPKSGKSTCIDTVNHFFRRLGYKVLAPTEGASKRTPYYLKDNLVSYNAWSATYAITHILEGRYGSDDYQLVIMDRGLFDALAWFEHLKLRSEITEQDCLTIQNFLLIDQWREVVDIVFLFETDPVTSLERENRGKLIDEPGTAMNPNVLGNLNEAYRTTREKYSTQFSQFRVVNTSGDQQTTPLSTAFDVAKKIIEQRGVE
jgi:thymidylate kinase